MEHRTGNDGGENAPRMIANRVNRRVGIENWMRVVMKEQLYYLAVRCRRGNARFQSLAVLLARSLGSGLLVRVGMGKGGRHDHNIMEHGLYIV